jgi:hypothetical protein
MTINLNNAVAALEALTLGALQTSDEGTLRKFHQLTIHWSRLAASETRDRAKLRRTKKSGVKAS